MQRCTPWFQIKEDVAKRVGVVAVVDAGFFEVMEESTARMVILILIMITP